MVFSTVQAPTGEVASADDLDDGDTLTSHTFALTPAQARALGLSVQDTTQPLTVTLSVQAGAIPRTLGQRKATAKVTYGPSGTLTGSLNISLAAAGAVLDSKNGIVKMTAPSPTGLDHISTIRSTRYVTTAAATCATFSYSFRADADVFESVGPLSTCESADDARAALAAASGGLLYLSESESAWTPMQVGGPELQQLPTAQQFAALIGRTEPGVQAQTRDFAAFFDRLSTPVPGDTVQNKAAKRYAALRKVFTRYYQGLQVYRVQDASNRTQWRVYIVGVNAFGVSGLWATSIET